MVSTENSNQIDLQPFLKIELASFISEPNITNGGNFMFKKQLKHLNFILKGSFNQVMSPHETVQETVNLW